MTFLHNSFVGSHGHLKSSNCVVDNRWMVRVSDFGLTDLRLRFDPSTSKEGFQDYRSKYLTCLLDLDCQSQVDKYQYSTDDGTNFYTCYF